VTKRTAHLTVRVAERPLKIARAAADGDDAAKAKPAKARKAPARAAAAGA